MKISSVIGVIFIVLKIIGYINWSWVWVLSPFWIYYIGWILLIVIAEWILKNYYN